uniref:SAP domain containing ribonucleoprotein n=1 Tax=Cairina moschata TaxID=8855 RepID=A0A8C3BT36_CAIMO
LRAHGPSLPSPPSAVRQQQEEQRGLAAAACAQELGAHPRGMWSQEEEQKPAEPPVKAEEPPVKSPDVNTEKKVVKITSEISQMERMQKRAERFNVPVSLESKKAARAARFGLATVSTKGEKVNMDKLKERAQRFGLNVSSLSKKSEEDEKLKKRKERFGIVTSSAGAGATEDTEASKVGIVPSSTLL